MFLVRLMRMAKLHFLNGVQAFLMPSLQSAKEDLPEDSLMRRQLEMTEKEVNRQHVQVLKRLR